MDKEELKQIRLDMGLGQTALARLLKTPRGTYLNWERGVRRIPGILEVALRGVRAELESEKGAGREGEV